MTTVAPDRYEQFAIGRMPKTDRELYAYLRALWGWTVPNTQVCPNHTTPFRALADAYFARHPIVIWKASRGFGGKTNTLGILGNTEAVNLPAQVSILGGSGAQSMRVYEAGTEVWQSKHAPKHLMTNMTRFMTRLTNGAWIETLMASQRSVRGTHPQRLRMDEIDEMDYEVLKASLGTVMRGRQGEQAGIRTQIVMSSTHQYPDGTMTKMLAEADEKGWPVYEWCYRESSNPVDGWLSQEEIEEKKSIIPRAMWDAEYDLQEPSFEGRAIDANAVEHAFSEALGHTEADAWMDAEAARHPHLMHVTGIDWAKERDLTVMATFDASEEGAPWRCVQWQSFNRIPWPAQVARVEHQYRRFGGFLAHDATGIGNVLADYLDVDLRRRNRDRIADIVLSGQIRATIFTDYISAIEDGMIAYPRIERAYREHKYVTMEDLFGKGHPPDSIVAGAVAWALRGKLRKGIIALPQGITRDTDPTQIT